MCAAVRETFEEAGVLLAGPDGRLRRRRHHGRRLGGRPRAPWSPRNSPSPTSSTGASWSCAPTCWAPWARWITPEFEERRYDTWFFLAALPEGQRTRDVSGEADRTVWTTPRRRGGRGYDRGELLMMPPTISTLRALTSAPQRGGRLRGERDAGPDGGAGRAGDRRRRDRGELAGASGVHRTGPPLSPRSAVMTPAILPGAPRADCRRAPPPPGLSASWHRTRRR